MARFDPKFKDLSQKLDFKFNKLAEPFDPSFGNVVTVKVIPDPYSGPYEVYPDFNGQVLETKNKTMARDVTVHPIQVERTSNPQGGITVYIGGIIDG